MDGAGNEFFACSALSGDQNGSIEISHAAHELINAEHVGTGTQEAIAANWFLKAMLRVFKLPFECGVFARAAEHGLEVADRWRSTTVAEGAVANHFKRSGAKAIFCHYDGGNLRCDELARYFDTLLQSITSGVQIQNH